MEIKATKYLGIDFGSRYSYMTYMTENDSQPKNYQSASSEWNAGEGGWPTILLKKADNTYHIASTKAIKEEDDPAIYAELKNRLFIDANFSQAIEYFVLMLDSGTKGVSDDEIVNCPNNVGKEGKNTFLDISQAERICIGYPALGVSGIKGNIENVIKTAYKKIYGKELSNENLIMQPEPFLVAVSYLSTNADKVKDGNVLVVDLGGYTMDAIVIRKSAKGQPVVVNDVVGSSKQPGGDINNMIFTGLSKLIGDLSSGYKFTEIENKKCKLFSGGEEPIKIMLKSAYKGKEYIDLWYNNSDCGNEAISLYQLGFYDDYLISVKDTIEWLAQQDVRNIDQVVFAGGSSNIQPLVRYILWLLKQKKVLNKNFDDVVGDKNKIEALNPDPSDRIVNIRKLKDDGYVLFMEDAKGITRANAVAYGACLVAAHPELAYDAEKKAGGVAHVDSGISIGEKRAVLNLIDSKYFIDFNAISDKIADENKKK